MQDDFTLMQCKTRRIIRIPGVDQNCKGERYAVKRCSNRFKIKAHYGKPNGLGLTLKWASNPSFQVGRPALSQKSSHTLPAFSAEALGFLTWELTSIPLHSHSLPSLGILQR